MVVVWSKKVKKGKKEEEEDKEKTDGKIASAPYSKRCKLQVSKTGYVEQMKKY